jgi:hypothetical protein
MEDRAMKFLPFHKNRIIIKKFNNIPKDSEVALLAFEGKIRNQIIEQFNNNFIAQGNHIENGGKSSTKNILTLIGSSAGSLGLAGATSGQLFMATANPATLMTLGNGVGSAVMGAGGIVAQAPFIPVAGALMPVVAPLIAFQAISTITIMNEFKIVNKKLDDIKNLIDRNIQRDEATNIGIIISAFGRLEDIENQFSISNQFTNDMLIRLALLEDSVNPLFERYNYLFASQAINKNSTKDDFRFKKMDAYLSIMTSILDMRIGLLRLKVNIQEDTGYMYDAAIRFREKISFYDQLWTKIQSNSSEIQSISVEMDETIEAMNWWQKNMPSWLFGKRKERIKLETKSFEFSQESKNYKKLLDEKIVQAKELGGVVKNSFTKNSMNLIYWKDEMGEHSYYTNDLLIK